MNFTSLDPIIQENGQAEDSGYPLANLDPSPDVEHLKKAVWTGQEHRQSREEHKALVVRRIPSEKHSKGEERPKCTPLHVKPKRGRVLSFRMIPVQKMVHRVLTSDKDRQYQKDTGEAQPAMKAELPIPNQSGLHDQQSKPKPIADGVNGQQGTQWSHLPQIKSQVESKYQIGDGRHSQGGKEIERWLPDHST
jgi:hypothetical protein